MEEVATEAQPPRGLRATLRRHEGKAWLAGLVLATLVVGGGLLVAPEVFWDKFLWEDIWGPTLADSRHVPALCWSGGEVVDARPTVVDGRRAYVCPPGGTLAKSGYTLTAEATYGLVLAALLYGIYEHVLKRFRVDTGGGFILGLLPLILLGPFARVMEDASAFEGRDGEPGLFAPIFISPWIYFQIAVYALAFLGVAVAAGRPAATAARRRALVATVLALEVVAYAVATTVWEAEFLATAPWWVVLVAAVASFGLAEWTARAADERVRFHGTVAALGVPLLAPSLWLCGVWLAGDTWVRPDRPLEPLAAILMLVFAFGFTFLVWWGGRLVGTMRPRALRFASLTSLALVFGHMIDGFATWIALKDPFGLDLGAYEEKHPVSDMLLQAFAGTPLEGLLFPAVKLAMVLFVIHLLDKEFANAPEGERVLAGLVKMAVFVLGFAPGMRDLLLVWMGF